MQHKKKLLTTLTLTILTLSLVLATIPMASATTVPALTPPEGPVGTEVTVTGSIDTAFGPVEVYWDSFATKIGEGDAKVDKSYEIKITVPEDVAGNHYVIVKDTTTGTSAHETFKILSEIVLDPVKGLPGDLITVTGTGFGYKVKGFLLFSEGAPTGTPATTETIGTGTGTETTFEGTLTNLPIEPTTVSIAGEIAAGVFETFTDQGNGTLTSDATPAGTGTINYVTGAVSVTFNTAPLADTDVTADYSYYEESTTPYLYVVTPLAGVTTNATGSFEASITIPAVPLSEIEYTVTAVDAKGNSADATILVDYYVTVKPEKGPPSITVDVSGRVEPAKPVEVKFGRTVFVTAFTTTSDADGYFSGEYTLPTLLEPAINYEFRAIWDTEVRTTAFEVLPAPTITLTPTSDVAGAKVTISGEDFSAKANITVYFDTTEVNKTATDKTGSFECTFVVPSVATGTYKVKAVDQYGASAEAYFTVIPPPAIVVKPRATEYLQGDTISFDISTTLQFATDEVDIAIVDPDGYPFWTVTWTLVTIDTALWSVPYEDQVDDLNGLHLMLPSDAPLGSWNWTATYTIVTEKKATGLFTVVARPTLSELDAKIVNLDEDVATLSTKVGTVKTSVDSISLKVTSIEDDVATIETDLGTLQGTVTSIDGNVATIETDVGTVKADVSDLVEDVADIAEIGVTVDLTPVWIAVALSLIAAIAACYGVVTLHRKIA